MTKTQDDPRFKLRNEASARTFLNQYPGSEVFRAACSKAGIEPTRRQVCKWRRKTGKAYQEGRA
jgi:hypothetical protein